MFFCIHILRKIKKNPIEKLVIFTVFQILKEHHLKGGVNPVQHRLEWKEKSELKHLFSKINTNLRFWALLEFLYAQIVPVDCCWNVLGDLHQIQDSRVESIWGRLQNTVLRKISRVRVSNKQWLVRVEILANESRVGPMFEYLVVWNHYLLPSLLWLMIFKSKLKKKEEVAYHLFIIKIYSLNIWLYLWFWTCQLPFWILVKNYFVSWRSFGRSVDAS